MIFLSALLLVLSYPPSHGWFLAWCGIVPLLVSLSKSKTGKQSFLRGFLFGILFWTGTIWWIGHVTIFGAVMLILYLSLYSGVFGWVFARLWRKGIRGVRLVASVSLAWTVLEWVRAHLFTGFGWNLLAYSQAPNLAAIQVADFVGAFGVSFVVVWANGAVFLLGKWKMENGKWKEILTVTALMLGIIYSYGLYRLNEKIPTAPVSVAVIQGNVPQEIKWEDQYRDMLFQRYALLTKTAALDNPELIIWPETSVVEDFSNPEVQDRVAGIAREANSFLLVGAPRSASRGVLQYAPTPYFNSAILFDPDGNLVQKHDKLHLVPYGEFIPFERQFPFQRDWIVTGDFVPGKEYTVFEVTGRGDSRIAPTFSVLICFEDIFPGLARQFVKRGARLLINISNDAWFGESGAAFQHAQASVFRAVENRVPVVRSTNTGYSCFIDRWGRIQKEVPAFTTGCAAAVLQVQK